VLQYFSSSSSAAAAAAEPQDSQNTAFSDIPTAVTIRWILRRAVACLFVCLFVFKEVLRESIVETFAFNTVIYCVCVRVRACV
jgi:hypothetical protein